MGLQTLTYHENRCGQDSTSNLCQSSMPPVSPPPPSYSRQLPVYPQIIARFSSLWRGGQQSEIGLEISTVTGEYAVYSMTGLVGALTTCCRQTLCCRKLHRDEWFAPDKGGNIWKTIIQPVHSSSDPVGVSSGRDDNSMDSAKRDRSDHKTGFFF